MSTDIDTARQAEAAKPQYISPTIEQLHAKLISLNNELALVDPAKLNDTQKKVLAGCRDYHAKASALTQGGFWQRKHSHLVWQYLHRVDESLLLLCTREELLAQAIGIKTNFDLNIKEERIRAEWIGERGKLKEAIQAIQDAASGQNIETHRYVLREALALVNKTADRNFWQLSMNTLTSVCSSVLLFALGLFYLAALSGDSLQALVDEQFTKQGCVLLVLLGLMGAYVSNVLTRDDFLYVRGAPFWRYFLHHLFAKPVLSAFAALFIFIVEKSKLVFAICVVSDPAAAAARDAAGQVVSISVGPGAAPYVYAVLAIASGFAADKVLRSMIDRVLKRLETKAEKNKDTAGN